MALETTEKSTIASFASTMPSLSDSTADVLSVCMRDAMARILNLIILSMCIIESLQFGLAR